MNPTTMLRVVGIIVICAGLYFGVKIAILPLIVIGCGMGFLFLP